MGVTHGQDKPFELRNFPQNRVGVKGERNEVGPGSYDVKIL
jgi:hypothetical protein